MCPTSSIVDERLEGMPVGTRGGVLVEHISPRETVRHDIKAASQGSIDSDIPHFLGEQNLEISVDGERVQVFTLPASPGEDLNIEREVFRSPEEVAARPPRQPQVDGDGNPLPGALSAILARKGLDDNWVIRVPLKAGPHEIRATFLMKTDAVSEGFRQTVSEVSTSAGG